MEKHFASGTTLSIKLGAGQNLGFDESFKRKWNYYLRLYEAAFDMRNINAMQNLNDGMQVHPCAVLACRVAKLRWFECYAKT